MTSENTFATSDVTVVETLDCSGLLCPLPVYKAALVLDRLDPGSVLELITTDPGALEDIPAMARQRGDAVLEVVQDGKTQRFLVEKGKLQ